MAPFANSVEHLRMELARLDRLLQRELSLARMSTPSDSEDPFRGLVITEAEIDALAVEPDYLGQRWRSAASLEGLLRQLDGRAAALRQEIDGRVRESADAGIRLALPAISSRLGLDPKEVDVLLVAVAAALEPRYDTLYAYLQNDVTRKRPSVDLALNLISRSADEKLAARRFFRLDAPLLAHRVLTLGEEPYDRDATLLRRFLRADETVVAALVDQWAPGPLDVEVVERPAAAPEIDVDDGTRERLTTLVSQLRAPRGPAFVRIQGESPVALRAIAAWIGHRLARPLLVTALAGLERDRTRTIDLVRNAVVAGGLIVLTDTSRGDHEDGRPSAEPDPTLWRELERAGDVVLLLGESGAFRDLRVNAPFWHVEIPKLDFERRRAQWAAILGDRAPSDELSRLADTFHLGGEGIARTLSLAGSLGTLRHPERPSAEVADIFDAGRMLTTPNLQRFAVRVQPRYHWDDIVLAPEKTEQLRRIVRWKRLRHRVLESWGFGAKLARGKGLNVLFSGPPGTGKTMAAEVLASDLSLDLHQIDLSAVVSKYIGETEKSLDVIFREASHSQTILFFDEADSLFGKRTELKDAHDRYANIEVNFLLQRIEQFEGIVILATNMRRNMDEAFVRRLHDVVELPVPDEALRERIWRGQFPRPGIRERDVDFAFLARQFKLTGGNIRNIVLDAAFRAAEEEARVGMRHLLQATASELVKHGRMPAKADFGPYFDLVQATPAPPLLVGH